MKQIINILNYAAEKLQEADSEQPDTDENEFTDGANHGAIEGRVLAYKDIIRYCAEKITQEL